MIDFKVRTETHTRVVYVLPSGVNWTDVGKATSAVQRDMEKRGLNPNYDDVVTFEAHDDEIHLCFDLPVVEEPNF